jgi:hypothetical protein
MATHVHLSQRKGSVSRFPHSCKGARHTPLILNPGYRLVFPASWKPNQLAISEVCMKKFSVVLLALAAALAFSPNVLASPYIVGTIGVTGGNDNWSTTALILTTSAGVVADDGGSFAGLTSPTVNIAHGSAATMDFSTLTFASPDVLVFTTNTGVATFTITGLTVGHQLCSHSSSRPIRTGAWKSSLSRASVSSSCRGPSATMRPARIRITRSISGRMSPR